MNTSEERKWEALYANVKRGDAVVGTQLFRGRRGVVDGLDLDRFEVCVRLVDTGGTHRICSDLDEWVPIKEQKP